MKILVASTNAKKLKELRALAADLPVEVVSPAELAGALPEVVEDGATFAENARKKALAFAGAYGLPAIADDSGLCVDALDGAPGVFSARYSGEEAVPDRDRLNNEKLLQELEGIPEERRGARFVCALCLAFPDGRSEGVEARWEGRILDAPRGEGGFGYDPLFLPKGLDRSSAELRPEEKQAVSHRGQAMRLLRPLLESLS